jgi:hypothetical protein
MINYDATTQSDEICLCKKVCFQICYYKYVVSYSFQSEDISMLVYITEIESCAKLMLDRLLLFLADSRDLLTIFLAN